MNKRNLSIGSVILGIVATVGITLLKNNPNRKYSDLWFHSSSDEELETEREKVRIKYANSGLDHLSDQEVDSLYHLLNRFDNVIGRRRNEKYEREHPNQKVIHREHGRYLPNDD